MRDNKRGFDEGGQSREGGGVKSSILFKPETGVFYPWMGLTLVRPFHFRYLLTCSAFLCQ